MPLGHGGARRGPGRLWVMEVRGGDLGASGSWRCEAGTWAPRVMEVRGGYLGASTFPCQRQREQVGGWWGAGGGPFPSPAYPRPSLMLLHNP